MTAPVLTGPPPACTDKFVLRAQTSPTDGAAGQTLPGLPTGSGLSHVSHYTQNFFTEECFSPQNQPFQKTTVSYTPTHPDLNLDLANQRRI